jgi:hypothetical protein
MSILQPISNLAARARRPTSQPSVNSNDSVLRATGVLSLLAIGAIHFLQIVQTTEQTPLLGVAFMLLIIGCLAVAARLAIRGDLRTWLASAAICAAAIAGYAFTRTFSTPLDNQDAGNWSCMLGPGRVHGRPMANLRWVEHSDRSNHHRLPVPQSFY